MMFLLHGPHGKKSVLGAKQQLMSIIMTENVSAGVAPENDEC